MAEPSSSATPRRDNANKLPTKSSCFESSQIIENMPKHRRPRVAKREARAKAARQHINTTIPSIFKSSARARASLTSTELISSLPPPSAEHPTAPSFSISVVVSDTLTAASRLSGRVAILNMASPLRPGGGILTGATSQEEFLCLRTTLYPCLSESFYRLPEVGGVYTPDVQIVRSSDVAATLLPAKERFFVDVLTAAMIRLPDVEDGKYTEDSDREMARAKMRASIRIFRDKGAEKIVLGAWGCGAYGNPVHEIARAWKAVLCGGGKAAKRSGRASGGSEAWDGLEIVFAIADVRMAEAFAETLGVEVEEADNDAQLESDSETEESDEYM